MKRRISSKATLLGVLAGALVVGLAFMGGACANSGGDPGSPFPSEDAAVYSLRVDPPAASATVTLNQPPAAVSFRAFARPASGGPEVDVTAEAAWSLQQPALGKFASGGTLQLAGIGGKTQVDAEWRGVGAKAALTVMLKRDAFAPGVDPSVKDAFTGATPEATAKPTLEYPEDGAVLPANLPPIQPQWSLAGDSDTYRVRFTSPDVLDVSVYTKSRELALDAALWKAIGGSTLEVPTAIAVDGVGPTKQLRSSLQRTFTVTSDALEDSAVYVWRSSTGSFRVLDIARGTDIDLPNDAPALKPGQPCVGCHRISRDGKRFAYTGANFERGTLAYDSVQKIFAQKIAPVAGVRGTYAAFNPLEDTTRPAMLLTVPQKVPDNTAGTVQLTLVDPDTGTAIPSDINQVSSKLVGQIGAAPVTTMPDWSPDGTFVTFVTHDGSRNFVRLLGDDVVLGSIVQAPVSWDPALRGFAFGAPDVLVLARGDGDTGQNNFLPTISPDGKAVAFTRVAGYWSVKTQVAPMNLGGQIAVVRRSDKVVLELARGSNGPGTEMSSTWPQWAPTFGKRYAWLAYTSERPYGHLLTRTTPQNAKCNLVQGQKQCKQLWITAIDLKKLASGTDDPSLPAFWVPGQDLAAQYVSPQWTKTVLPPPR